MLFAGIKELIIKVPKVQTSRHNLCYTRYMDEDDYNAIVFADMDDKGYFDEPWHLDWPTPIDDDQPF